MNENVNDNINDNINNGQQSPEAEKKKVEEKKVEGEKVEEEKSLEGQIAELKEQHLLDRADMENLRKRLGREMEKTRLFAIERFARDLLPILDNMRRALASLTDDSDARLKASLEDGVRLTLREIEAVLARHQVRRIEAEGQSFDPNRHEALFEVPQSALPPGTRPGTIMQIIEEGYMLGERLLRPARVGIAAAAAAAAAEAAVKPSPEATAPSASPAPSASSAKEKAPETGENGKKES